MLRPLFVVLLAVAVVLGGCKASTKPKTLVVVSAEEKPRVRRAPFAGEYRLYAAAPRKQSYKLAPRGEPLATHRLGRREPIGFRVVRGETSAVAGRETVPLERGQTYLWQMRADKGQVDNAKTVALLVVIGAGIGGVIAASTFTFTIGMGPL